jgi:AbrB family looped-hinge helix DNA binding protein
MTIQADIKPSGETVLPADVRRKLGVEAGGKLVFEERGGEIVVRRAAESESVDLPDWVTRVRQLSRKMLDGKPGASVDDFIRERRKWQE